MQTTITINGIPVKRDIPEGYHQVKFGQFVEVAKSPKDTNTILSIITGIDVETIKKAKITNIEDVILALAFFNKDAELKVPDTCLGYKIPKDLGFECVAQYEDLQLHLNECREKKVTDVELMASYPLYCAVYACSQKYGTYDWAKVEEMAPEFMNAPATEVLAIGNFTLLKLIGLKLGIKNNAPKPPIQVKRWKLVLKAWVMSLVLPVRLRIWKRRHLTKKVSY
jgi:hypothetical protein